MDFMDLFVYLQNRATINEIRATTFGHVTGASCSCALTLIISSNSIVSFYEKHLFYLCKMCIMIVWRAKRDARYKGTYGYELQTKLEKGSPLGFINHAALFFVWSVVHNTWMGW